VSKTTSLPIAGKDQYYLNGRAKSSDYIEMNRVQIRLSKLLTILICLAVYIFPNRGDSSYPVGWGAAIDWGRYFIVQNGTTYDSTTHGTIIADMKNYGAEETLPKIHFAMVNIVTGTVTFPEGIQLFDYVPWVGLLVIPVFMLSWHRRVARSRGQYNQLDSFFVLLYSLFPTASVIALFSGNTNASIPARAFFITLLYLTAIITIQKGTKKPTGLIIVFLTCQPLFFFYYHTWSYYYILYIFVLGGYLLLNQRFRTALTLPIFAGVCFLASALYLNSMFLKEFVMALLGLPVILSNLFTSSSTSKHHINPRYLDQSTVNTLYNDITTASIILLGVLCLLFAGVYLVDWRDRGQDDYGTILVIFSVGQLAVGGALFAWGGLEMVLNRIFSALIILSMFYLGYIFATNRRYLKQATRGVVVLIVIASLSGYAVIPHNPGLSSQEEIGIQYVGQNTAQSIGIFTDFRLGPPLLYYSHDNVKTFHAHNQKANTIEAIIDSMYYNVSNPEIVLDSVMDSRNYYVMTSERQHKFGIVGPTYTSYQPASKGFQSQWVSESAYNRVYENGELVLHQRQIDSNITFG